MRLSKIVMYNMQNIRDQGQKMGSGIMFGAISIRNLAYTCFPNIIVRIYIFA